MARKPKTVYERNKRDAKQLSRDAKVGDVYYTIMNTVESCHAYQPAQRSSRYEVTHMHPLLGGAMFGGSCSAEHLVLNFGPVYTERPRGMYGVEEELPDTFHPYGGDNNRRMPFNEKSSAEIDRIAADMRRR